MIDRERLQRLASLARVELSDAERDELLVELSRMLEFAASLAVVDVAGVPEWTPPSPPPAPTDPPDPAPGNERAGALDPSPASRTLRPDEVTPSLPREVVLALAPEAQGGFFRVPRTVDEE